MTWQCAVCDQEVDGAGPWCRLYLNKRQVLCRAVVLEAWVQAVREGDREVAALLRRRWWDRHGEELLLPGDQ